jgi:hypothetical protein
MVGQTFQEQMDNLQKSIPMIPRGPPYTQSGKVPNLSERSMGAHCVTSESNHGLKAIQKWPTMRNKHELRSFLGLCTYYRQFISGFADIAKPLTRLTEEKQACQWPLEVKATFQSLKETLHMTPVLSYPQLGEKFIIDTDMRNRMRGVLSQVQDGQELLLPNYIRTLNKTERNWLELLAIMRTPEHFHKYLYR